MDDISTGALTGILIALLFVSAFFSSSETGMMSLNRYRLRHLVQSRHKAATRVERLLSRPDRLIGLILIGNNLVNILASAIATLLAIRLFGDYGVAVATIGLTLAVLIFSEVTPKTLAALYPEKVAFPASIILRPLMVLLYPAVWAINAISNGLLALFRINPQGGEDTAISSEELRTIVNEAGALIPRRHQDMLVSILDLEKVTVDDIMVPRNEIYGIDITQDWKSINRRLLQSPHTKVLLYRDNIDDALGFIHARDALRLLGREELSKPSLMRAAREVYFIPEATPLNVQLLKFQRNKERIGLIVDEYGDIQGLITLDDILEEIVGDFTTTISPTLSDEIKPQDDGSYLIEGSASIRDLNKELNWNLPTDGPRSLNGLILEYLEDIPEANIGLRVAGYPIEILEVENNVIKQVRVQPSYYQP
ncbi:MULTISPECIES: HlyC/CorC family transporter [Oceanimonas]|uniref:Magnesium/cobalt efflux protein n=1 Tax=Oceanimonas doudoroffii TaxID=84158 RepID=A0A233RCH6_9GAMM|nr:MULTISPECIES: CNNM domain-containing protein [Oceanimonas]NHI00936.1 Hemolysin C [Oceanimonas sp. MB9]OXY81099.1 magnesium/cobalt efflux protein [Oceanimonas doudoroffii]